MTSDLAISAALVVFAYLLGSVSPSVYLGMIFKKVDGNGNPYFIVLTTPKDEKPGEKPQSNPINRMVTLGHCSGS